MTDSRPLLKNQQELPASSGKAPRVVSLDVFRGLSVFEVKSKAAAARNAACRGLYLFLLGVLLQGGYFHGITSLTYGVDLERIRWLGILQRISIGYLIAALCEIWLTRSTHMTSLCIHEFSCKISYRVQQKQMFSKIETCLNWMCIIFFLLSLYMALSYGLYVPDWDFKISAPSSSLPLSGSYVYKKRRETNLHDLVLKSANEECGLKECNISSSGQFPETSPSWCRAPFEPEGLLSSLTATVACIIGLQYGHILAKAQDHKTRTNGWFLLSFKILALGLFLVFIGIPVNKSLYTVSYMLITSASAGIIFCALYILVDIHGYRRLTCVLEWMGKHSLSIYVLVISNILVIGLQGFYWKSPNNNIVHWIVSHVKARR
uniref:Heparan-alpha-glucosaminide N-acetyltransferase-like n=1 Tax=Cucumis melo TaxID=3656 RepID=A0A9I9DMC8_CUCME